MQTQEILERKAELRLLQNALDMIDDKLELWRLRYDQYVDCNLMTEDIRASFNGENRALYSLKDIVSAQMNAKEKELADIEPMGKLDWLELGS